MDLLQEALQPIFRVQTWALGLNTGRIEAGDERYNY
jgi:hypothetical protein